MPIDDVYLYRRTTFGRPLPPQAHDDNFRALEDLVQQTKDALEGGEGVVKDSVQAGDIVAGSVTTPKIADGAVNPLHFAAGQLKASVSGKLLRTLGDVVDLDGSSGYALGTIDLGNGDGPQYWPRFKGRSLLFADRGTHGTVDPVTGLAFIGSLREDHFGLESHEMPTTNSVELPGGTALTVTVRANFMQDSNYMDNTLHQFALQVMKTGGPPSYNNVGTWTEVCVLQFFRHKYGGSGNVHMTSLCIQGSVPNWAPPEGTGHYKWRLHKILGAEPQASSQFHDFSVTVLK